MDDTYDRDKGRRLSRSGNPTGDYDRSHAWGGDGNTSRRYRGLEREGRYHGGLPASAGRDYARGDYWPESQPGRGTQDNRRKGWEMQEGRSWRGPGTYREERLERYAGPHAGRGPSGYRRADERIREDACERLTWHGHIDASDVTVRVEEGEITLEGTVESRREKRMAEDALETIAGVRDIHNRLRLQTG